MAAVKVDVSRRGEFCYLSGRKSDCRAESKYGAEKVILDGDNVEHGGSVVRHNKRTFDDLPDENLTDFEDGEIEAQDVSPAEKRKKISPVLWGKEGRKSVAIHKNDGHRVVSLYQSDESPADMHSSLTDLVGSSDEIEAGQLDEEDFSRAPKISTSRWAFDDEEEDDERKLDKTREITLGGSFEKEGLDGGLGRSSSSCSCSRGEHSESELEDCSAMEVDDGDFADASSDRSCSDSEGDASIPEISSRHMHSECRSVYEYERLGKISEGSYGIVYRAKDKITGEMVALKKLKMGVDREGFPLHYLREINALMSFDHPAIINVKEVVLDDNSDGLGNVYMVMEYMEHDMKAVMESRRQFFSQSEVKCLMLQLLEGVKYLHDNWVLHRDLKTSNLLLNNKGDLKICDFGMARQYGSPLKPYTQLVVTLWYRAPELLLGSMQYSTAVDMWSVGCIMAELLCNKPLFDGKTELEQVNKIFRVLGTPNEKIWPGYSQLSGSKALYANQPYNKLREKFPHASFTGSPVLSNLGFDLLSKLLTYDPEERISAYDALNHAWFREVPLPKSKEFMPTFPVRLAGKR